MSARLSSSSCVRGRGSQNAGSSQRVHVPNNLVPGFWVIVIIVQALGEYMIIRYLDP